MAAEDEAPELREPARLLALPKLDHLPWWLTAFLLILIAGLIAGVAYLAAENHPGVTTVKPADLQPRVAQVYRDSQANTDDRVVGDYVIERFYVLDILRGDRYVADFLKGRIDSVQAVERPDGPPQYTLYLDVKGLRKDRLLYNSFVTEMVKPPSEAGRYLGLTAPDITYDVFLINYDGSLPAKRVAFRGPKGEDAISFLKTSSFTEASKGTKLLEVDGFNFLLNTSESFHLFRDEYGLGKTMFLSELIIVDATSPVNKTRLEQLRALYGSKPETTP